MDVEKVSLAPSRDHEALSKRRHQHGCNTAATRLYSDHNPASKAETFMQCWMYKKCSALVDCCYANQTIVKVLFLQRSAC